MSDSPRRGDPGIVAGVPVAKGLWMLGASGAVAALTVAGTVVASPQEPAVSPSSQVLSSTAPSWTRPAGAPSLDKVPLGPRIQPSTPNQAAPPDVVSAAEVPPPAVVTQPRAAVVTQLRAAVVTQPRADGVAGERSLVAPKVWKVVAAPVQHVQAVVEAAHPEQVVPETVHRVQTVVQPVRFQWFGRQSVQPAPPQPMFGQLPFGGFPSRGFDWFGSSF